MTAMHARTDAADALSSLTGSLERIEEITQGRVHAHHTPFLAQVDLRLDPSLHGLVPHSLPTTPNTVIEADGRTVLWLGPDEWLVVGAAHTGKDLVGALDRLLVDHHRSVVDVSANRVAIELSGSGRADLLAKGCSLDLHPRSWSEGMCAQTTLGKAQVILVERADSTTVFVQSSFAGYLVEWLLAAAAGPLD